MKWKFLGLLLTFGFSSVAGQIDPSMMCFTMTINGDYTGVVHVTNMQDPPFNDFQPCDINHPPGLSNDDVVAIQLIGNTLEIPTAVCESFPNARRLESFNVRLSSTVSLYYCHNLEQLDLSQNNIMTLDANAFSNSHLTHLNLSRNSLNETHQRSLANLEYLEVIDLSHNRDILLPAAFFNYPVNLKELYLSNSGIENLHKRWFYNFSQLVQLDISHNPLTEIPASAFTPLISLKTLQMNSCNFTMLGADTFVHNTELEYIDMSRNAFVALESEIFRNQSSLQTLILSHNNFEPLPGDIFESLINLRVLEMNNCNIQKLQVSWFSSMKELRVLSMWGNSIREIPYKTLGVENNLEELYLQDNELRVLDATSFALLKNLKALRVDNNNIYAVDSHFIQQPELLNQAWFLNNDCIDINIDDFSDDREDYLMLFWQCFHNFDNIPVSKLKYFR
jgi:Leucine-rich repeat (LRR) protein